MTDTLWRLTLLALREKLKREKPLTLPESRWLAWEVPRLVARSEKDEPSIGSDVPGGGAI